MLNEKMKLFLVDDDALFLKSLEIDLNRTNDYAIDTFLTGEECLVSLSKKTCPDIIILDYHLDGISKTAMNGIQTLDKIKLVDPSIPVIILSSQDKIDVAISCMHHQATDYVVKSETAIFRLQKIITALVELKNMEKQLNWYMDRM